MEEAIAIIAPKIEILIKVSNIFWALVILKYQIRASLYPIFRDRELDKLFCDFLLESIAGRKTIGLESEFIFGGIRILVLHCEHSANLPTKDSSTVISPLHFGQLNLKFVLYFL